jgi:glycosyltransferase involved in cell wall biosynthesis
VTAGSYGRVGMLLIAGESFGGMERRFARLTAFLPDVIMYTTGDAYRTMTELKIELPANRVRLITGAGRGSPAREKLVRATGLLGLMARARREVDHLHLAMDPRGATAVYGLLSAAAVPYSLSIADSTLGFGDAVLRMSARRARFVDCLSDSIRRGAIARLGPNARPERFLVAPCSFTDLSRANPQSHRDIDVVMVSRFVPGKGIESFVEALEGIDGIEAHICGFGPLDIRKDRARVYRTSDSFGVLGRSKVFLSLQETENYPSQSLLEAMASGCAIVATDVGETRRMLDERCAVFVEPGDVGGLRTAILALLSDPERRRAMGARARERVTTEHTVERYAAYFTAAVRASRADSGFDGTPRVDRVLPGTANDLSVEPNPRDPVDSNDDEGLR